jgi:hypothetical protein
MQTSILSAVARLSDCHLLDEVKRLAARERDVTAELIAHLAEIEERGLHHAAGFGSMFEYCRDALHLSEYAAYGRIEAARAARKFPVILEMLVEGSLNLTAVGLLGRHLTRDNYREVLVAAEGRSKREVEELVARLHPQPDVPSSIRKLPSAKPVAAQAAPLPAAALTASPSTLPPPAILPPAPARSQVVTPLAPDRYKVQFTVSKETCEKLRLAQDLLRHVIPNGDPGAIFDRALTVLLENLTKTKLAATGHPHASRPPAPGSRHIPAEVKRAVWARDGGRCAFVAEGGRRCTERAFLEFHHVEPYAVGGEATVENISLCCKPQWLRGGAFLRGARCARGARAVLVHKFTN